MYLFWFNKVGYVGHTTSSGNQTKCKQHIFNSLFAQQFPPIMYLLLVSMYKNSRNCFKISPMFSIQLP